MLGFREGIQDYRILRELKKRYPEKAKEITDEIIRSLDDYEKDDPQAFDRARAKALKALVRS